MSNFTKILDEIMNEKKSDDKHIRCGYCDYGSVNLSKKKPKCDACGTTGHYKQEK